MRCFSFKTSQYVTQACVLIFMMLDSLCLMCGCLRKPSIDHVLLLRVKSVFVEHKCITLLVSWVWAYRLGCEHNMPILKRYVSTVIALG